MYFMPLIFVQVLTRCMLFVTKAVKCFESLKVCHKFPTTIVSKAYTLPESLKNNYVQIIKAHKLLVNNYDARSHRKPKVFNHNS